MASLLLEAERTDTVAGAGCDREVVQRAPHRLLRGWVRRYTGYRTQLAAPLRRRQLPSAEVTLIIGLAEPHQVSGLPRSDEAVVSARSFVAGLHSAPVVTEQRGFHLGVGVGLTPFGAYALIGVPMSELAGRVVDLTELLGGTAEQLVGELARRQSWSDRFALLDRILLSRIASGPRPAAEVVRACRQLSAHAGRVPIAELVDLTGWSHRHLAARFRDQVGLTPKSFARVLRLQHSLRLLERPETTLADVAVDAGFYDQAHMNREFGPLAGCTPGQWVGSRLAGRAELAA